jgi:hypothetical protein
MVAKTVPLVSRGTHATFYPFVLRQFRFLKSSIIIRDSRDGLSHSFLHQEEYFN